MRWEFTRRFKEILAPNFEQIKLVVLVEGFDKGSELATLIYMGKENNHFGAKTLRILTGQQLSLLSY